MLREEEGEDTVNNESRAKLSQVRMSEARLQKAGTKRFVHHD